MKKYLLFISAHLLPWVTLVGLITLAAIFSLGVSFSVDPETGMANSTLLSSLSCSLCHGSSYSPKADRANTTLFSADKIQMLAQGTGRLYGYTSASSVRQGGAIQFHISTYASVIAYDIYIYRMGATGLTHMMTIPNLPGGNYACGPVGAFAGQEGVTLGCNWPVAYTLNVPANWPSGTYYANLVDADDQPGHYYNAYIPFIITEDQPGSTSNILFIYPTYTWQAYNDNGGLSFYTTPPARLSTFNRPYSTWWQCGPLYNCANYWEVHFARWLISEGYTVEYAASEDIHANPALLSNYTLVLLVGHDEYWSKEIRDGIDNFISAGGNLAIFSGNTGYRQVRYRSGDRTLICYKDEWSKDPLYGVDNIRVATEFAQKPAPNWPENSTTGLGFRNGGWVNTGAANVGGGKYTVYRSSHWVYEGTGLQDGQEFWYAPTETVEVDGALFTWQNGLPVVTGADSTPSNFTILGLQRSTDGYATMGLYTRPQGGTVFNAATIGWGRGLWSDINPQDYQIVRQITRNVINRLRGGTPPPPPTYPVQATSFTYQPLAPLVNTLLTFTATITPAYASPPVTHTWLFGDGTAAASTTANTISHSYTAPGTYTVTLHSTNNIGSGATYSQTVTVIAPDPTIPVQGVSFTYLPNKPTVNEVVHFTGVITPLNVTLPVSYTWQFGDGVSAGPTTSNLISHTYTEAGTYTVTLTAATISGSSVMSNQAITLSQSDQSDPDKKVYLPFIQN